jgi:4-hydroxy-tetrahydrodipicolinate synthase
MPFKNGEIDYESLEKIIDFQHKNGVDGIILHGTTGEAPAIKREEFIESSELILKNWATKLNITIGVSKLATDDVLQTIDLLKTKPHNFLITPPAYSKPTQDGIFYHFEAIAKHTNVPIVLYNVPGRTISDIMPKTLEKLVNQFANIVGIKDATGSLARMSEEQFVLRNTQRNFAMLTGDDQTTPHFILSGGDGVISVISNCLPKEMVQMVKFLREGKKQEAFKIYFKMFNLIRLIFVESNPIPIKYVMHKMGYCELEYRLPMCKPSASLMAEIDNELKVLNLLK